MKRLSLLISAMIFGFMVSITSAPHAKAADINVPDDYATIQEAIDAAVDGDVVIVDPGTYYENINFLGKGITVRSMDPDDPNLVAATIIDGNQIDSVVTFHGKEGPDSVLIGVTVQNGFADEGGGISCRFSSPSIINCIIADNKTNCSDKTNSSRYETNDGVGGGIYCFASSPTIDNCIIIRNSTPYRGQGGGIYCKSSLPNISNCTPNISNCIISMNYSERRGEGIYCNCSSPNITDCIISENSVYCYNSSLNINNCIINNSKGYGIYCTSSSPCINECLIFGNSGGIHCQGSSWPLSHFTISNCIITGNSAPWDGGGIYCDSASPRISGCIISENIASEGGGIHCLSSSPTISDCAITENSAQAGGGISCLGHSAPNITNCIIAGNEANMGGGVYCQGRSHIIIMPFYIHRSEISLPRPTITNCTIVENTASVSGGGIFSDLNVIIFPIYESSISGGGIFRFISKPIITSCILWENSPDQIFGERLKIAYSDVQEGWNLGIGNIDADPLFVDPNAGDYHLQPDSPCINMGAYGTYEQSLPWSRSGRYLRR